MSLLSKFPHPGLWGRQQGEGVSVSQFFPHAKKAVLGLMLTTTCSWHGRLHSTSTSKYWPLLLTLLFRDRFPCVLFLQLTEQRSQNNTKISHHGFGARDEFYAKLKTTFFCEWVIQRACFSSSSRTVSRAPGNVMNSSESLYCICTWEQEPPPFPAPPPQPSAIGLSDLGWITHLMWLGMCWFGLDSF